MIAVCNGWYIFSEYDGQSPVIHEYRALKTRLFLKKKMKENLRCQVEINVAIFETNKIKIKISAR